MNLANLMDEMAAVMGQITGLRVTAYPPKTVVAPAGYVSYPASIDYDQAYNRGVDRVTGLTITLLSSDVTTRTARDTVGAWASGSGEASLKALAEAHHWTSCDVLTITSVSFDVEQIGSIPYLAAIFTADAIGSGGS